MQNYKLSLETQRDLFLELIQKNQVIKNVLDNGFVDDIKNWYLVAGCLNQTIWNQFLGNKVDSNIKDYDVIYFDSDLSEEKEKRIGQMIYEKYQDLNVTFDVVNQARVHIWADKDWGLKIKPLTSCEYAIASWPITASCIGVNKINGLYSVMAPYGLTDSFEMILRPNKTTVMRQSDFNYKVKKLTARFPSLKVIPWED